MMLGVMDRGIGVNVNLTDSGMEHVSLMESGGWVSGRVGGGSHGPW